MNRMFFFLFLCCFFSRGELNGISLNQTRVIYWSDGKGEVFSIKNHSNENYLVQSMVKNIDGSSTLAPFIIVPPLSKLDSGQEITERIIYTGERVLPNDVESVFYISIKLLPKINNKEKRVSGINIGQIHNIKMFYRNPSSSYSSIRDANNKLIFSLLNEREFLIKNPSPYFITFHSLSVNGMEINKTELKKMIPPHGELSYLISDMTHGLTLASSVSWELIDENGSPTPITTSTITSGNNFHHEGKVK